MVLSQHDHMVQALPPDRSNHSLAVRILPRTPRCDRYFLDIHSLYATTKFLPIDLVAIAQQVSRCRIVRKRFDHLVCRPKGRGMLGHIEVNHAAAVMSQQTTLEKSPWAR